MPLPVLLAKVVSAPLLVKLGAGWASGSSPSPARPPPARCPRPCRTGWPTSSPPSARSTCRTPSTPPPTEHTTGSDDDGRPAPTTGGATPTDGVVPTTGAPTSASDDDAAPTTTGDDDAGTEDPRGTPPARSGTTTPPSTRPATTARTRTGTAPPAAAAARATAAPRSPSRPCPRRPPPAAPPGGVARAATTPAGPAPRAPRPARPPRPRPSTTTGAATAATAGTTTDRLQLITGRGALSVPRWALHPSGRAGGAWAARTRCAAGRRPTPDRGRPGRAPAGRSGPRPRRRTCGASGPRHRDRPTTTRPPAGGGTGAPRRGARRPAVGRRPARRAGAAVPAGGEPGRDADPAGGAAGRGRQPDRLGQQLGDPGGAALLHQGGVLGDQPGHPGKERSRVCASRACAATSSYSCTVVPRGTGGSTSSRGTSSPARCRSAARASASQRTRRGGSWSMARLTSRQTVYRSAARGPRSIGSSACTRSTSPLTSSGVIACARVAVRAHTDQRISASGRSTGSKAPRSSSSGRSRGNRLGRSLITSPRATEAPATTRDATGLSPGTPPRTPTCPCPVSP